MARRFRCPVCGSMAWSDSLSKDWTIETYIPISLGKAHGFRYEFVNDFILVQSVKNKIIRLARQYTKPVYEAIEILHPFLALSHSVAESESHKVSEKMSFEVITQ